jgi:hypothetical protein
MDRNIDMAQARGPVAAYMRAWKATDAMPPLPYVELDAGAALYAAGLTVGTGTPAAYAWSSPAVLYTPDNAPTHVIWTQEHNGVRLHGGVIDIGHIRTDAPIMWATSSGASVPTTPTEDDMPLTSADANTVWAAPVPNGTGETMGVVMADLEARTKDGTLLAAVTANTATLAGIVKSEAAIQATLAVITSGGGSVDTAALAAQIKAVGDAESTRVAALQQQVAVLEAKLAAAGTALASS